MKNKLIEKIVLLLPLLFLYSCIDTTLPEDEFGVPHIENLSEIIISRGDTLIINGVNFGLLDDNNYLTIANDETELQVINSSNVLQWQTSRVKIIISDSIRSGSISIFAYDSISNYLNFQIREADEIIVATIPAGEFQMGATDGNYDEAPIHRVVFDKSMIVSTTEISQRIYKQVMGNNPSYYIGDRLPVNNVEWSQAIKFCNELSIIENLQVCYELEGEKVTWIDSSNGWRLPSEAEWEYFAKAERNQEFSYEDLNDNVWFSANSGMKPQPVGLKYANAWGLYDVLGNMYEWCWDYYSVNYYQISPELNPKGAISGNYHVKRGGAFNDGQNKIRFSNRQAIENLRLSGFRIIRNN